MFIKEYHELNQQLVINTYTLPIIGDNIHQLEGNQYATALYLNMEYYTIRISSTSQFMMAMVTEFWEFRYNCPLMGMFALGDIF